MAAPLTSEMVEKELCAAIQTLLALEAGAVAPDTPLRGLGIDSLRFVSLMLTIERKYGVSLMKGGLGRADMESVRTLAARIVQRSQG
jgi:acyl carrier protein